MKIANNVEILELPGHAFFPVLLWDEGHLVLVDAGMPGQTELITEAIAKAGKRAEDLTQIILTHQDIDHIGCVNDLLKLAPGAKVIAHKIEAPYISGEQTPVKLAALLDNKDNLSEQQKAWMPKLQAGFKISHVPVDQIVEDDEVLPYCGGIRCIFTPGHTPGHLALFLEDSKILIGGDAINIEDGRLIGSNPVYTFDEEEAAASFAKIKALGASGYAVYHGGFLPA